MQHQVLGRQTCDQLAFDPHTHALHGTDGQALRGQHMLDIGSAHPKRQSSKCTVRTGVRVTRHHGHAGQRGALLRPHHMDDALGLAAQAVEGDAELLAVDAQLAHLGARQRIFDRLDRGALRRGGGHVVVGHSDRCFAPPGLAAGKAQAFKGLWARHFVNQMTVHVEQRLTV